MLIMRKKDDDAHFLFSILGLLLDLCVCVCVYWRYGGPETHAPFLHDEYHIVLVIMHTVSEEDVQSIMT